MKGSPDTACQSGSGPESPVGKRSKNQFCQSEFDRREAQFPAMALFFARKDVH